MRRFLHYTAAAYADLERRARRAAYINFPDIELPPGCVPQRARIGLKIDGATGATTLLIERGVRYYGANHNINRWVQNAGISFKTFEQFHRWITSDINKEFGRGKQSAPASATDKQPIDHSPVSARHSGAASTRREVAPPSADASKTAVGSAEQKLPAADEHHPDPVSNKLLGFLVRQIARNYGIEVESIDAPLFAHLRSKLLAAVDQATCDTVIDDVLGGPFALASVEGHRKVELHAGPPITCSPISKDNHC